MDIDAKKAGDALVVSLSGEITARAEQDRVTKFIESKLTEGERLFLLDLSQVDYISSLGIAGLAAAYMMVSRQGGQIKLIKPRPSVANVLHVTRVGDIFKTYGSVEEALGTD